MTDNASAEFVKKHAIESEYWVSGMYVLDEAPVPALILVEANPDVWQASVYMYSFLGLSPTQFFIYERVVWAKGEESVYKFGMVDETQLECQSVVPVLPDGEEVDLWDFEWEDPRSVANLLCPHLSVLHQFKSAGKTWAELAYGEDDFESEHADIIERETPDFWS